VTSVYSTRQSTLTRGTVRCGAASDVNAVYPIV